MRKTVVCLMGPTASGKTDVALHLMGRAPFEIISIDSAMVYRGMDIGTAKPNADFLKKAPHHLIDVCDPIESYSAAKCYQDVSILCADILARGNIPLLVGGTMMYFQALQKGLSCLPEANHELRAVMNQTIEERGWPWMHAWLERVDPKTASRVHAHDTQRIQRALEVYQLTGAPLSSLAIEPTPLPYVFVNLALVPQSRAWLHDRIGVRFQHMLQQGFVAEVEALLSQWPLEAHHPSMRSVGYRQIFACLRGEAKMEDLLEKGTAATRQLAKRQLTWLRNSVPAKWFSPEEDDFLVSLCDFLDKALKRG